KPTKPRVLFEVRAAIGTRGEAEVLVHHGEVLIRRHPATPVKTKPTSATGDARLMTLRRRTSQPSSRGIDLALVELPWRLPWRLPMRSPRPFHRGFVARPAAGPAGRGRTLARGDATARCPTCAHIATFS